ncbi:hypothetical protein PP754_gp015 [Pectobacterium phage Possum]|uniref:Uncharacterized protein n=1 Tax=Pectobacterium phage Possum TaxID=2686301 RepID=A0A7T0LW23_9CAUD|nr:hypothetical protein PP754_gp015 [Pectobacterium phage Possum]QPL10856.1 hypothetical protein Possum_00015 [Pectobacterium phage Possum]QPL10958.1 hypothetical protein Horatius_00015 [Pectobacterium phage Horatius]
MSYQLRSKGFSRVVCHLSQKELDYLRTAFLLVGSNQVVELQVETFNSGFGISSYLQLVGETYLEGLPLLLASEKYERIEEDIQPVTWVFNITHEIPF